MTTIITDRVSFNLYNQFDYLIKTTIFKQEEKVRSLAARTDQKNQQTICIAPTQYYRIALEAFDELPKLMEGQISGANAFLKFQLNSLRINQINGKVLTAEGQFYKLVFKKEAINEESGKERYSFLVDGFAPQERCTFQINIVSNIFRTKSLETVFLLSKHGGQHFSTMDQIFAPEELRQAFPQRAPKRLKSNNETEMEKGKRAFKSGVKFTLRAHDLLGNIKQSDDYPDVICVLNHTKPDRVILIGTKDENGNIKIGMVATEARYRVWLMQKEKAEKKYKFSKKLNLTGKMVDNATQQEIQIKLCQIAPNRTHVCKDKLFLKQKQAGLEASCYTLEFEFLKETPAGIFNCQIELNEKVYLEALNVQIGFSKMGGRYFYIPQLFTPIEIKSAFIEEPSEKGELSDESEEGQISGIEQVNEIQMTPAMKQVQQILDKAPSGSLALYHEILQQIDDNDLSSFIRNWMSLASTTQEKFKKVAATLQEFGSPLIYSDLFLFIQLWPSLWLFEKASVGRRLAQKRCVVDALGNIVVKA